MYTNSCVTLFPSDSLVSPSLHVQWGNTPLLRAAQKGYVEVACFLLDNGSNVHEQNNVSRLKRILAACDTFLCMHIVYDTVCFMVYVIQSFSYVDKGIPSYSIQCVLHSVANKQWNLGFTPHIPPRAYLLYPKDYVLHRELCMCAQEVICTVVSLFLLFNAGRTQCLSLVCCGRPSCCHSAPCPQDGGPPL